RTSAEAASFPHPRRSKLGRTEPTEIRDRPRAGTGRPDRAASFVQRGEGTARQGQAELVRLLAVEEEPAGRRLLDRESAVCCAIRARSLAVQLLLVGHARSLPEAVDAGAGTTDDRTMSEGFDERPRQPNGEIDAREAARIRRRDRDAEAEARALLRPGMGKVFKQRSEEHTSEL